MLEYLSTRETATTIPISLLSPDSLAHWHKRQSTSTSIWVKNAGFKARQGELCIIPGDKGTIARVVAGNDTEAGHWGFADLPSRLPAGRYKFDAADALPFNQHRANEAALGWVIGCYDFCRYRKSKRSFATLVWPKGADRGAVSRAAEATALVRDLINTPAGDMGPAELAEAARTISKRYGGRISVITGDKLLTKNYPAIHAVGRASSRPPRLIDMRWGNSGPRVTLVGKGVCFDSGGLDLKTVDKMQLMKKDMGGGAYALALGGMIMDAKLPVRLRVLVPAVENAVSGNAFRPLDVLETRKGITVEVGNTDAEGRLVLCDALAEADREKPDLIMDFATLTGAARVALGADIPALFCNQDHIAEALLRHGREHNDLLWRLPIYKPYRNQINSSVADINNTSGTPQAGAIIAALFLSEFVSPDRAWVHIDTTAWNMSEAPGRPIGGEARGLRASFALIEELSG